MHLIKTLRELGCSPQQIREYGQNRTPESVLGMLRGYSMRLSGELAELQAKMDMLQSRISLIEEGQAVGPGKIELCTLPAQAIRFSALGQNGEKNGIERLRRAIGQIRQDGNIGCPLGYAYNSFLEFYEKPEQPAQLLSYDPQGPDIRPAGEYLVGTVSCYYDQTSGLLQRMHAFAARSRLRFHGPAYTIYLLDVASVTQPEQYLLQIAVEVERIKD